jgi:hypothetical protein
LELAMPLLIRWSRRTTPICVPRIFGFRQPAVPRLVELCDVRRIESASTFTCEIEV